MKFSTTALLPVAAVAFLASFVSANETTDSSLEPRTSSVFDYSYRSTKCSNLPSGGPSKIPSLPSLWPSYGQYCGDEWYYHSTYNMCVPKNNPGSNSNAAPNSCPSNAPWSPGYKCCKKSTSQCKSNEWFWTGMNVCLPNTVPSTIPSCPSGKTCPSGWYYSARGYCVPKAANPSTPSCSTGSSCSAASSFLCDVCKTSEFWWGGRNVCVPKSPSSTPSCPTAGSACPSNFYWSTRLGFCVPKAANPPAPTCASGSSCDLTKFLCSTCKNNFFWFPFLNVCLPNGGSTPGTPPPGKNCDTKDGGRRYHSSYKCCVPNQPTTPSVPSCTNGNWSLSVQCCIPGPQASSKPSRRRNHKQIVVALPLDGRVDPARCPNSLTACPLSGTDYECLDPEVELTSCGGCASTGAGQNCLLIANSDSVTCSLGTCKVLTCRSGTSVSTDGSKCI